MDLPGRWIVVALSVSVCVLLVGAGTAIAVHERAHSQAASGAAQCTDPVGDQRLDEGASVAINNSDRPYPFADLTAVDLTRGAGDLTVRFSLASAIPPASVVVPSSQVAQSVTWSVQLVTSKGPATFSYSIQVNASSDEGGGYVGKLFNVLTPLRLLPVSLDGNTITVVVPLAAMPDLPEKFRWNSFAAFGGDTLSGGHFVDRDICPPSPTGNSDTYLSFPGKIGGPSTAASGPGGTTAAPASTVVAPTTTTPKGPSASTQRGCPEPLPDRLSPEQVARCFYAGWAANDRSLSRKFTTYSDQATTELFKLAQESRNASFTGCNTFNGPIPGIGDLTPPNAALQKCRFSYAAHIVDVYVNSTASLGSVVVAIGLDGGGLGSD